MHSGDVPINRNWNGHIIDVAFGTNQHNLFQNGFTTGNGIIDMTNCGLTSTHRRYLVAIGMYVDDHLEMWVNGKYLGRRTNNPNRWHFRLVTIYGRYLSYEWQACDTGMGRDIRLQFRVEKAF